MTPVFFETPGQLRAWFERNHADSTELLAGFYKKGAGVPTITWPESVDEALSFGWIDGVRKNFDATRYTIRFTPRRARSIWSTVNVGRVAELSRLGRMQPSGLKAFTARSEQRSGIYSYEQKSAAAFSEADERNFREDVKAWDFFQAQSPGYRQTLTWWVISGKKEESRVKRLATLIENCRNGIRLR